MGNNKLRFKRTASGAGDLGETLGRDVGEYFREIPHPDQFLKPKTYGEETEGELADFGRRLQGGGGNAAEFEGVAREMAQNPTGYLSEAAQPIRGQILDDMVLKGPNGETKTLAELESEADWQSLADLKKAGWEVESFKSPQSEAEFKEQAEVVGTAAQNDGNKILKSGTKNPRLLKFGKFLLEVAAVYLGYKYITQQGVMSQGGDGGATATINPAFTDAYGINSAGVAAGTGNAVGPGQQFQAQGPQPQPIDINQLPIPSSDPLYSPNMNASSLTASSRRFRKIAQAPAPDVASAPGITSQDSPPGSSADDQKLQEAATAIQRAGIPTYAQAVGAVASALGPDFDQLSPDQKAARVNSPEVLDRLNQLSNRFLGMANVTQRLIEGLEF